MSRSSDRVVAWLRPPAVRYAAFVVLTFVLGVAAVELASWNQDVAPWWPAAGTAVLALLVVPRRAAPAAVLGLWVVTAASNLVAGRPWDLALAFGVANAAEAVVVAGVLTWRGRRPELVGVRDAAWLVVAALAGSMVAGALVGLAVAALAGGELVATAFTVAASHGSAVLVVVPVALAQRRRPSARLLLRVLQALALLVVVLVVFWPGRHAPMTFLPLPFLVWGVFQEPPRRVAVQVLALAVLATTLTALGGGPFAAEGMGDGLYRATMLQVFLVTYAATTVFLTAARSEQLALAERVAEREQLLRGGILDAQVGLVILRRDTHGRTWIMQSNAKAAELLAPEVPLVDLADAPRPRHGVRLVVDPPTPFTTLLDRASAAPSGEVHEELRLGAARDVELIVVRTDRPDGQTVLTVQASDVTARRRAEQAARRALEDERRAAAELRAVDQQRSDFVAAVSHELRTPVTNVVGYVEVLRDDDALSADQRAQLDVVARNARRLGSLVENLLALGSRRVRAAGQVDVTPARAAVEAGVAELATAAQARGVRITVEGPEVDVVFDRGDLRRVVANLVRNAVQFSPPDGTVEVLLEPGEDRGEPVCRLTVTDRGPGIPADELERVFERFYRGAAAERDAVPGVGLGLTLVRDLVRRNHAVVVLRSPGGAGTTAEVRTLRVAADAQVDG